jgi:ATP-binding cassette, subfamily B, bacterial MsbA
MKLYFRILSYSPKITKELVLFFLFALLSVVFSTAYLGMIQPMLEILFNQQRPRAVEEDSTFSWMRVEFETFFKQIVAEHGRVETLFYICIIIVILVFLGNIFRYLERMTASRIRVDVVKNLRMDIFRQVSRMHIGFFSDQRKGDLLSRFTNDLGEVEGAVVNGLKAFKEPLTLIAFMLALFSISVKLTLFTMIVLPVTGTAISEIIRRLKKKAKQSQESVGRIVNILDETFSSMRVINAFNARNFMIDRLDRETTYHKKVNLSISRKNELASPMSEFLGVLVVAFILYYGGQMAMDPDSGLTPAKFMTFLTFYASMIQPAKNFSNGITSLQKGTAAASRIFGISDLQPAVQSKPDAQALGQFSTEIEFRNVSFAYDKELVLKDINLTIKKGKTIALVGPSGGGKSTLADLVPRFYDPTSGAVLLDGVPLTEYELESLRRQMGVVTQESILFNDTIFNNIAFGMANVNEEDVINAARVANAHDFIMQTENGYQTMTGERGSKLSGGQRQRLSIARAVLKNPPVLILDEATSALDSESEKLVQDALNNLMKNRTSIVIAHRLSTIQHADEIVVIQNGTIAERGTHDELVKKDGLYRKLSEIQGTRKAGDEGPLY